MPSNVVQYPRLSPPPVASVQEPPHALFAQSVTHALDALNRILDADPTDVTYGERIDSPFVAQQLEAAKFVLSLARTLDADTLSAARPKSIRARQKRLATLQAEIEELKLEALRVQAEASVAALKRRPR
jgi:hypothetical protein